MLLVNEIFVTCQLYRTCREIWLGGVHLATADLLLVTIVVVQERRRERECVCACVRERERERERER